MRQIATSTLSNQDISSALLCYTYTADADREIFFRLFADQVAGDGTYTAYVTIQRLGAGSAYEVQPRTVPTVAAGITSIGFTTMPIPVKNTDVVKVYLDGLAGDTVTPDIITEVWEADYTRPTTPGQHNVDVTSGGAVGMDWANVESPTTAVGLSGTTVKTATDVETDTQNIQSRLPASLEGGYMSSDAVAISGSTLTADAVQTNIGNLDAAISTRASQASLDVIDDLLDTEVASILSAVDTEVAAIKAKTDLIPVGGPAAASDYTTLRAANLDNLDAAITTRLSTAGYTAPPATGAIADAVWDEDVDTTHQTAGSAGKKLDDAGDEVATPSTIADAVLEELIADHKAVSGSLAEFVNLLRSMARGKMVKSGDTQYLFYDVDGTTLLWTATITAEQRTTA